VILAIALPGVILFLAAALTWAARLLHISGLDAMALAEKAAFPHPASALEWPELQVRLVVPESDELSPAIVQVGWPAHPGQVANLLVTFDHDERRALSLLLEWSAAGASVATQRHGMAVEFRRRQSLERVHATLLAEDYQVANSRPAR
jgi:hypothetical protein